MNELTPDLKSEIDRKSMEKAATLDQMLIEVCMIRNETSLISERLVRIESRINRVVELGKQMAAKVKEAGHISQLQAHAAGRREGLEAVEQQREEAGWVSRSYMDEALALKDKAIAQIQDTLAARCREMEREIETLTTCGCEGCDDNLEESAFCFPCMNKVQKQVTQLQATLAAREARIAELVEGLRTIAYADWSPELNKEISAAMERGELKHMTGVEWLAQRLLTQLEAHRKEG